MNDLVISGDLQDLLAAEAKKEVSGEKTSDRVYLTCRGKRWRAGDEKLPAEIDVVVLIAGYEKTYYDSAYDPEKTSPPACFALSLTEDLVPHDVAPNKQSTSCASCAMNKFETAAVGKGKACKDSRRMVMVSYGADGMDTTQVAQFKLPPTSLKNWASYAKKIGLQYNRPTFAVVTTMSFDDKFDYPVIEFKNKKLIEDPEEIRRAIGLREAAVSVVLQPYNVEDYVAPTENDKSSSNKSKMS
jgi:hypothetical protein